MGGDEKKRIVGDDALGKAVFHDHVSALLFVVNVGAVFTLAFMAMSNNTLKLPDFLQGINHQSMESDMHLASTSAGLAFSGVLVIVIGWLLLLWMSAFVVIILGQILMFCALLAAAYISFAYAGHASIPALNPKSPVAAAALSNTVEADEIGGQINLVNLPTGFAGSPGEYAPYFYALSIVCCVLAALLVLWLICIRERIAFTAQILSSVSKVLLQLPELLMLQLSACILVLGWTALWSFAALEVNGRAVQSELGAGAIFGLNVLTVFSFFWGQLVLVNVSLVTTCGAVGAWYFSPLSTTSRGCLFCRPAVCAPLSRAVSTSLGSIALGSLLIAIVRTIIWVVKKLGDIASEGNPLLKVIFCCFTCCLGCLESLLRWLTDYAFVYVAIYGMDFISAGMKVVSLLSSSGIGAIAQQTLVTPVLALAAYLGLASGIALGYAATIITGIGGVAYLAMAVGGAVGYVLTQLLLAPVDAAAKTLFVCYAEEPNGMQGKVPELAEKIAEGKSLMPKGEEAKGEEAGMVAP